jgi:hypothetical protein
VKNSLYLQGLFSERKSNKKEQALFTELSLKLCHKLKFVNARGQSSVLGNFWW